MKRYKEAVPYLRRAVTIIEATKDKNHPWMDSSVDSLAVALTMTGRLKEVEPLIRERLQILVKSTQATGEMPDILTSKLDNYAWLLKQMGDTEEQVNRKIEKIMEPLRKK